MRKIGLFFITAIFATSLFGTGGTTATTTTPPVLGVTTTKPKEPESKIPPKFEGTTFINNGILNADPKTGKKNSNVEGLKTDRVIGDDRLPEKEVETGTRINRNLGKQDTMTVTDESGNVATLKKGSKELTKENDPNYKTEDEEKKSREQYDKWRDSFDNYVESSGTEDHEKKELEQKRKQREEVNRQDISIRSILDQTINSRDVTSGGQTIKQMFENVDTNMDDDELKERDKNATQVYRDSGYEPRNADTGILLKKNVGSLKEAYKMLPDLQKTMTEKMRMPVVQCQISRNLLPAYFCPIKGKDGFRFPGNLPASVKKNAAETTLTTDKDGNTVETLVNPKAASLVNMAPSLRKVNLSVAKDTCNQYCRSTPGDFTCIKQKKIKDADINITKKELKLFPDYSKDESVFTISTNDIIPIKNVAFKVDVRKTKTEDENTTQEDWEKFIKSSFIRFRYSILEIPEDKNIAPITIIDRALIVADKETASFDIPINRQMQKLQIKFWKPYVSDNPFMKKEFDYIFEDFTKKFGGEIAINDVRVNYTSDSFFYCPIRQLVSSKRECGGLDAIEINYGEGKDLNTMYLCDNTRYKIGPESTTGAFFDEKSCSENCFITEECKTTYDHYKGDYGVSASMYKAEVDCVDDKANTQCTKAQCEALFRDETIRPVNEAVVQNDNTVVYTIRNKALTNQVRPKIDIERELGADLTDPEQLNTMMNIEQKDAAYLYMTKNLTMNMVKYPIGTPSPHKMSYIMKRGSTINDGYSYYVDLKPNSFDFNTEQYIYLIARLDQRYHARYGSYYIKVGKDRPQVNTKDSKAQFKDYTYLIKKPDEKWEVFRKEEFAEYWNEKVVNIINSEGQSENKIVAEWLIQPDDGLIPGYFGKYDAESNTFKIFDKSEKAPYYKKELFEPTDNVYRYTIVNDHINDIYDAPGSLMHDQAPKDNESNLEKKYLGGIHPYWSGKMSNFAYYLVYSDKELSYEDIMKKIEGDNYLINTQKIPSYKSEWGVFDYLSNGLFNSGGPKHDGQLNNNIKPFILGKPEKTSIITEWEPSLSEHGKKVFKFLFLYDDGGIKNPFERKDNKPDKYLMGN